MITFLKKLFQPCQHDWVVLDKTTVPSRLQILKENAAGMKCQIFPMDMERMTIQETLIILKCNKCGNLQTKLTDNRS